ncbi:leucyl/phenylalanyl-tRNA--protein transferase [Algirhabdus cladophorae]|uniref:leucyl/phenylalanyl-tRNA--protein transferase n=1 Tax=Algirhabdus cladophorae TaxID=3377108 RepID=UPI003B8461C7
MQSDLTPDLLLRAYASGIFPMSEGRTDPEVFWVSPEKRGIFDVPGLHISKSLRKRLSQRQFDVRVDTAFDAVVSACADRHETWINTELQNLYGALAEAGHAHCIEIWQKNRLIGGVYGVALNAAFFGESMFSRETDASKLALVYLMDRLIAGGFTLFDTQFITPHLASLGAFEVSKPTYEQRLSQALARPADFYKLTEAHPSLQDVLQRSTQTS